MNKKAAMYLRGKNSENVSSTESKFDLGKYHGGYGPYKVVRMMILCLPYEYSITCVKRPLSKRPQIGFQDQLSLNAGQKYCRMLPLEHSAILSTFIKLPFVIKIFVLSILRSRFTQVLLYLKKDSFLNQYQVNSAVHHVMYDHIGKTSQNDLTFKNIYSYPIEII